MNDMTWVGAGHPEGDLDGSGIPPGGEMLKAAMEQDDAVRAAITRLIRSEDESRLDEIQLASRLLWSYVGDLEKRWSALESTTKNLVDREAMKEAVAAVRDVREATQLLAAERSKVDKLRKDIAGAVGGGSLDLDAARDEIGRRLACLRRAGAG